MINSLLQAIPKRILLLGWLLMLHAVLALGAESPIGRSLLIVHFGLFILWQPFVGSRLAIPRPYLLLFVLLLAAFVGLGWWALIFWMMLLAGVVGGRLFFDAPWRVRMFYLVVLGDLFGALILLAVPSALIGTTNELHGVALYGLPLALLIGMVLLRNGQESELQRTDTVDLVYSLFILLLLAVLVAGSIAVMFVQRVSYFEAVLSMVVVMALVLLALALVWSPRFGFSGLAAVVSRYMLADSLPFDRLLRDLAESARSEDDPARFIANMGERSRQYLTWVTGAHWVLQEGAHGHWGQCEGVPQIVNGSLLRMTLFSSHPMSPTLLWHSRLFVQLLEEYCQNMVQARKLGEMSYVQAVHQTGARLTHDVKNLLQSLNTLCAVCADADSSRAVELHALMQRQLPAISQRLQATLGKLEQQPVQESVLLQSMDLWWQQLCARYEGRGVTMYLAPEALLVGVPATLFDSAAENLLQNAFDKLSAQKDIAITLRVTRLGMKPCLTVEDTGSPLSEELAARLGTVLPNAENGLGIGLYQLHRQAEAAKYVLRLASNKPGCVRFELKPQ